MAEVKHNNWFMIKVSGQEYRAKWIDYGITYASMRVDIQETYTFRKYFIFGPNIIKKRWKNIIWCSRSRNPDIAGFGRRNSYYDSVYTRMYIERILLGIEKPTHSTRI